MPKTYETISKSEKDSDGEKLRENFKHTTHENSIPVITLIMLLSGMKVRASGHILSNRCDERIHVKEILGYPRQKRITAKK